MREIKTTNIWIFAVILTILAVYYQRKTGPTYPKKFEFQTQSNKYSFKLIRTFGGNENATINIDLPEDFSADLTYRKYPTKEDWTTVSFMRNEKGLSAELPNQPPAGKLEYFVKIKQYEKIVFDNSETPVIIRFKGDVPAAVMIPHIFFMFFAMFLSNLSGFLAAFKKPKYRFYSLLTLIFLIIGGGIMGPIVQKYAFGEYWTGVPFGWDLTDNKTLVALIAWIVAVIANAKKERPKFIVAAAIILLIIYSIPHSLFGSQLDHESGEVMQGFITNPFIFLTWSKIFLIIIFP